MPLISKMGVARCSRSAALFMQLLRAIPLRTALVVPLVGLMLGGVIDR